MSSSTSVFKYKETRVAAAILFFLFAVELFFGFAGGRLSEDVRNIERIEQTAEEMGKETAPRVLFLGNSILNAGIDGERFRAGVGSEDRELSLHVSMVYPDSSSAGIWDYLLRRYFVEPGRMPEDLVLVTGKQHLLDAPLDPISLGAYYVSDGDTLAYLRDDSGGYDDGCAFFLGRYSATVRSRKRVSPRVFDTVLPYYQENWNILNRAKMEGGRPLDPVAQSYPGREKEPERGTRHLEAMVDLCKDKGVRLTVVVAPGIRDYEIDTAVARVLEEKGVKVVDLSEIAGLGADGFADADHVNSEGRKLFTDALARELANYWRR